MTFSAYDVVLSPAVAPLSLRCQGTVASDVAGAQGAIGVAATISVGVAVPRSELIGATPPV